MAAAHILVSGRVQGVGYRMWTERTARQLALRGWVRNLRDGRVEIHAEGPQSALDELIARCADGPRSAAVTQVTQRACATSEAAAFEIRRTSRTPVTP